LQPKAVAAFYEARNAEPAWNLPGDAESIRKAIDDLAEDGLDPADYHRALIDTLLAERKSARTDELDTDLELTLSDAVAAIVDHVRYGRVRPKTLNPRWNVDPRETAPPLEQAIARVAEAPAPAEGIEQEKLSHFIYRGLKKELALLETAARSGGWPPIPAGGSIAPGARDSRIP
jgi:murein L,D-transpeptidase YcbB/YkuD